MEITLRNITVRDIFEGYSDNGENGVVAYGGLLDVRPPYQREFVYKDDKRNAVIDTVRKDFPLNIMYWAKTGDNTYEILDGQQRTISICQYLKSEYSIDNIYFHNLSNDEKEQILDYKLSIYICEGTDSEKLDWFRIVNVAGEPLKEQELRNAVYAGSWVTDAKRHFSRSNAPAVVISEKYVKGVSLRQDYLEKAIKWISDNKIEAYMAENQHEPNSMELWLYFQSVISWTKALFPIHNGREKLLTAIDWGYLYNQYHTNSYDSLVFESRISELLLDEDVDSKKGIYLYLFDGNEKHLNLRDFRDSVKRIKYQEQDGICAICLERTDYKDAQADHITPWSLGGKTNIENCQMLCASCNRTKSNI